MLHPRRAVELNPADRQLEEHAECVAQRRQQRVVNGHGLAHQLIARVPVEIIDNHRQGFGQIDAVLADQEPSAWQREPEPQGAIPRLRKLLAVVLHRNPILSRSWLAWVVMVPLGAGSRVRGGGWPRVLAAGRAWSLGRRLISPFGPSLGLLGRHGRGTPDASFDG